MVEKLESHISCPPFKLQDQRQSKRRQTSAIACVAMSIFINNQFEPLHPRPLSPNLLSPTCVMHHATTEKFVEPLILPKPRGDVKFHPKGEGVTTNYREGDNRSFPKSQRFDNGTAGTAFNHPRNNEPWKMCPVAKKCRLTVNPVESIVAQVAGRIRPAAKRRDHKTPLSLAVSMKKQ
jgi:hypothetical protein